MSDSRSVTVHIYGNEYTLKGEADPAYIAELAKFVDSKMADIGRKSSAPAAKVAILAAMNIADEFHRLEKAKAENLKLIETLEKNLLEMKRAQDGSLRHSLEMKEQLDRYKTESGGKNQMLEEVSEAKAEMEESKKKVAALEADLAKTQENAEILKKQSQKVQGMLDSEMAQAEGRNKEINELKISLGEVKAELQKTRDDLEKAKGEAEQAKGELGKFKIEAEKAKEEAEKAKKEMSHSKTAQEKSNLDAEQLLEELEKAQKDLKFTQAEMDKLRETAAKGPVSMKISHPDQPPLTFPTHEKVQALLKKIDAILE